ncbi:Zn-dependent exopeptidase [Flagelloscypha sp. PMI_526]|nr:Zn-dependent exopeptidase [Flagelloscypha sp. PMI_526]
MKFAATFSLLIGLCALVTAAPLAQSEFDSNVAKGLRLLSLSEDVLEWHTEDEKLELMRAKTNFFDVTETYPEDQARIESSSDEVGIAAYSPPSHQTAVKALIDTLDLDEMKSYLTTLAKFNNRYYKATTGENATQWVISTCTSSTSMINAGPASNITVARYAHSFTMGSVIVKIPATTSSTNITILGAHLDSINQNSPQSGRAPGMDDDGTGVVNLLEALRGLIDWRIQAIFAERGVNVKAMLMLDMTGWNPDDVAPSISLTPDYVDSALNTWTGTLIDAYSSLPKATGVACGYACSDHASWYKKGYPTVYPFETKGEDIDPYIHSANDLDTVTGFSYERSFEFAKLVLAFAYELAI